MNSAAIIPKCYVFTVKRIDDIKLWIVFVDRIVNAVYCAILNEL